MLIKFQLKSNLQANKLLHSSRWRCFKVIFLCLFLLFANFRSQSKTLSYNNLYFNCVMTTTLKDNGRGQIFFFFASIAFPCFVGENNMNGKIVVSETRKCFFTSLWAKHLDRWLGMWMELFLVFLWMKLAVGRRSCVSDGGKSTGWHSRYWATSIALVSSNWTLTEEEKANIELDKLSSN